MLLEKYKPKFLKDIIGQANVGSKILEFLKNYKRGDILLLHGPVGCGKTSIVHAIANEHGYSLIEANIGGLQKPNVLIELLATSTKLGLLSGNKKIIFLDEVDNIVNFENVKVAEILNILRTSKYPVILAANDVYSAKFRPFVQAAKVVKMGAVTSEEIERYLKKIASQEKLKISDLKIKQIARSCNGDVRSALLELESAAISEERMDSSHDVLLTPFDALKLIFKSNYISTSLNAIQNCAIEPEKLMKWMEKNIPLEFSSPAEIAQAFEYLSIADLFMSRVISRQNWTFRAYMSDMLASVNRARLIENKKQTFYQPPDFFYKKENNFDEIAKALHCSKRKFLEFYLPYLKNIKEFEM